jgi:arylsulfatase
MSQQPNILFILTDQWRGDCLSALGHPDVETPNLDMVARQGVLFTSTYSTCPSCIASRASLFTGLRPKTHGRIGYQDQVPWNYSDMLAHLLSQSGYHTHCVGKTHFFPQRKLCGFHSLDSYEGAQNFDGKYVNDYEEWLKDELGHQVRELDHGLDSNSWTSRPSHLPESHHVNTWTINKAIDFLRRRDRTKPFFLNVSFIRPHPPLDPPTVYYTYYQNKSISTIPVGKWATVYDRPVQHINAWCGTLPDNVLVQARRAYYAQISHIDNQIGRLLIAMRQLGIQDTWVVFTSDHGEMLGDHHLFRKTYPYEGSAKVPLIIKPPNKTIGTTCPQISCLEDLYPTFLDLAGIPIPNRCEGASLLPWLEQSNGDSPPWREYIQGEHASTYDGDEGTMFITDGRIKYIWFTESGREQLFDLENDPQEYENLVEEPSYQLRLEMSRNRLIQELSNRREYPLTDGSRLLPGVRLPSVLMDKATAE